MGIEVCDLRKKFQLLKTYGCINSLDEIAQALGRAEKTLWGWADGNATTDANQVPSKIFEEFQHVFTEALEAHVSPERAAELLFAPVSYLENELRRPQATSLLDLIEAEGDAEAIRLIRHKVNDKHERGLIEIQLDRRLDGTVHQIKQGEWFRLLVERDMSSFNIVALQNGAGLWGAVPWAIDPETGYLHLPGNKAAGEPALMREINALGRNLFVVMATKKPVPSWMSNRTTDSRTLDAQALADLVDFCAVQEKTARWLGALTITVASA